jgi:hypothetical protein
VRGAKIEIEIEIEKGVSHLRKAATSDSRAGEIQFLLTLLLERAGGGRLQAKSFAKRLILSEYMMSP